jgi:hypothetical protein
MAEFTAQRKLADVHVLQLLGWREVRVHIQQAIRLQTGHSKADSRSITQASRSRHILEKVFGQAISLTEGTLVEREHSTVSMQCLASMSKRDKMNGRKAQNHFIFKLCISAQKSNT